MKGIVQLLLFAGAILLALLLGFPTFGVTLIGLAVWLPAMFLGAPNRAIKVEHTLKTTLMAGETLIGHAIQHRVFALFSRRALIAITSSRILNIRRGLLGGYKMLDVQWKDLRDVKIEQNVLDSFCGSNLRFEHLNARLPVILVDGVPSDIAAAIYTEAQSQEQAWEEKRRVRGIEEMRAAAGGVVVNTAQPSGTPNPGSGNRMLEEIQKAKELLDMGAVSDAEFQEMKSKILGNA